MGVDSKLLVNAKWNVKHIETLLVEGLGHKVTKAEHKGDHSFLHVTLSNGSKRTIYVAQSCEYGGLDATLLSLRSNDEGVALFRSIAKVLGGFVCDADYNNAWECMDDPHQGNARFVLDHTVLRDALSDSSQLADKVAGAIGYDRK